MRTEAEFALALRQQRLLLRSEALRGEVALHARGLEAPFAAADRVHALALWLYAQRAWIAGAAIVVLVIRPRRAWRFARWAWRIWRAARTTRAWLVAAGLLAATAPSQPRDSAYAPRRDVHGQDHRIPAS